jgi:archaeosine-15-forming tRNA-guanine transglycosylase
MANHARKFVADDMSGDYISNTVYGNVNDNSNQPKGLVQVNYVSGSVQLQMRLDPSASWFTVKTYSASALEEIFLANEMRVVVTGGATVWVSETH